MTSDDPRAWLPKQWPGIYRGYKFNQMRKGQSPLPYPEWKERLLKAAAEMDMNQKKLEANAWDGELIKLGHKPQATTDGERWAEYHAYCSRVDNPVIFEMWDAIDRGLKKLQIPNAFQAALEALERCESMIHSRYPYDSPEFKARGLLLLKCHDMAKRYFFSGGEQ